MSRRPIDPPIVVTTEFGVKDSNSKFGYHTGVDYAKATGNPVYAPQGGVVTDTGTYQYNGKVVQIRGQDGLYHRMLHNSQILVTVGQAVKEGQRVALSGDTGLSTASHVHWDICTVKTPTSFAQFKDPAKWLATPPPPPPVVYPKWVRVSSGLGAYVRSAATTSASLAGSRFLPYGTPFRVAAKVKGQSINGNPYWYRTMYNNYVWSGNVK